MAGPGRSSTRPRTAPSSRLLPFGGPGPHRFTLAITTVATLLLTRNVRIWVQGGSSEGSAPYPEDDTLAGGAVVVGGDAPAAVAPDQHPGRAHQSLARDSGLPREDNPVLADHDGRVAGKKADVHRAGGHPRPVERARERRGYIGADLLTVLLVAAGLDHAGILGGIGHERLGVAGFPRLVHAREHVENGLPVGVGPCRGGLAGHRSPRFSPRGGERHPGKDGRARPERTPRSAKPEKMKHYCRAEAWPPPVRLRPPSPARRWQPRGSSCH